MNQSDIKRALCVANTELLRVLLYFGGNMLLPQLRALCLAFGVYASAQMVNRAVRELREASILDRQTWIDNSSDFLLARKYAYRFYEGKTSQEVATPRRPATMAPHIAQARKIDWLLTVIQREGLTSLHDVHRYLTRCGCTVFLRLPELPEYYTQNAAIFAAEDPEPYMEQTARLEVLTAQRAAVARAEPVPASDGDAPVTLELAHRRGVYIERIYPKEKAVRLVLFAGLSTSPRRIMDWVIDTQMWIQTLMPYYRSLFVVYTLSDAHRASLKAGLTALAPNRRATHYYQDRLITAHLDGSVKLAVKNTDFIAHWCGNIQATNLF